MEFASPEFFYFLVRRYWDVSCSQVCRKSAAGRELLDGLIHFASEFRLGGEALFGGGEAKFVGGVSDGKNPPCDLGHRSNLSHFSSARSGTVRRG
jgi:hypothetical protein